MRDNFPKGNIEKGFSPFSFFRVQGCLRTTDGRPYGQYADVSAYLFSGYSAEVHEHERRECLGLACFTLVINGNMCAAVIEEQHVPRRRRALGHVLKL